MRWACRPFRKPSWRVTWVSTYWACRASAIWPRASRRNRSITRKSWRPRDARGGRFRRCWRESLDTSDRNRLSVTLVDVAEGKEAEFVALASHFGALLIRKKYGISEMIRDEAHPLRFYSVRRWNDAASAAAFHADLEAQKLTAKLYLLARVTHIVNGARPADPVRLMLDDQ